MHTQLGNKVATLLKNHAELEALTRSDQFDSFDPEIRLIILELHEKVDAFMNSISGQIDVVDLEIADLLCSLNL